MKIEYETNNRKNKLFVDYYNITIYGNTNSYYSISYQPVIITSDFYFIPENEVIVESVLNTIYYLNIKRRKTTSKHE